MEVVQLKRSNWYLLPLMIALSLTFFLFYLDEGYFDLRWTKNALNWFWFVVYSGSFFLGQAVIDRAFFKNSKGKLTAFLNSFLGLLFGIVCLIVVFILISIIGMQIKY